MPLTRWLLVGWIVLFTGLTAFAINQNHELGKQGKEAHDALCVFKLNLAARAHDGEAYVADVKADRRPIIPGFTIAELERSVASQRAAVNSLRTLDCPKEKP